MNNDGTMDVVVPVIDANDVPYHVDPKDIISLIAPQPPPTTNPIFHYEDSFEVLNASSASRSQGWQRPLEDVIGLFDTPPKATELDKQEDEHRGQL